MLSFCATSLDTLHQAPSPCIRCRIAKRREHEGTSSRSECASTQRKCRLEREMSGILEPGCVVFEAERLRSAPRVTAQSPDPFWTGLEIDVDLYIRHFRARAVAVFELVEATSQWRWQGRRRR